jgi:8-amino-7-oxononanoate synthase
MEGDISNLPQITALARKYNADVYVDEAHSLGVFGKGGTGICNHFGITEDVDLIMGTFSKSLAAIGGFIATDKETINYLRHTSRPYIFSASISPSATASVIAALDVIKEEPERVFAGVPKQTADVDIDCGTFSTVYHFPIYCRL